MRRNRSIALTVGVLLAGWAGGPVRAADEDITQLRRQLVEQRQSMERLERRLLELEGKEQARRGSGLEAGYTRPRLGAELEMPDIYDGGFFVKTKDDSFALKINGFGQFRYTFFSPEQGKDNNNFDLALGRLAFSGHVFDPKFSYFLQF